MSWTTIVWSGAGGLCLGLAGVQLLVWLKSQDSPANLFLAIAAIMAAIGAQLELRMMHAATPEELGRWLWWLHVPIGVAVVALGCFTYLYLRAGRRWLLWLLIGLRAFVLVANLFVRPNLNFSEITGLRTLRVWNEAIAVPVGTPSPWIFPLVTSSLLLAVFASDAAITAWHRGQRRQGLVVGGSITLVVVIGVIVSQLHNHGLLTTPYMTSPLFILVLTGIAYDMSLDVVRVQRVAGELRRAEERIRLAVDAADLTLWDWNIVADEIWTAPDASTPRAGGAGSPRTSLRDYLQTVHPDDRARMEEAVRQAVEGRGALHAEFRIVTSMGETRWVTATGQVEHGPGGRPLSLRGILADVTRRRQAEQDAQRHLGELLHVQRVTTAGQLSTALSHELSQPMGAILRNAEAAEMFLEHDPPDLDEVRDILEDIKRDEQRAVAIMDRMKSLLKRREPAFEILDVRELVEQVESILHTEAQARGATLQVEVQPDAPKVRGERVHLQQVLLNLVLNSLDAVEAQPDDRRRVALRASRCDATHVEMAVVDNGVGIAPEVLRGLFTPFHTTKTAGNGFGLAISKTIVEAHGGEITGHNNPDGGATFRFTVKAVAPDSDGTSASPSPGQSSA